MSNMQIAAPGSQRLATGLYMTAGPGPHLLQPPRPPTTRPCPSSATCHGAGETMPTDVIRKGLRLDLSLIGDPFSTSDSAFVESPLDTCSEPGSPGPFVNTKYTCAGGLDSPNPAGLAICDNDVNHRNDPHTNHRRRWSVASLNPEDSTAAAMGPTANERKRRAPLSRTGRSWNNCLFTFVVDAAGRVWQYARATGLIALYSGGGRGYSLRPSGNHQATPPSCENTRPPSALDTSPTPVPEPSPDSPDSPDTVPSSVPTKQPEDPSRDSWIMVPDSNEQHQAVGHGSEKRKLPKVSIPPTAERRRSLIPVAAHASPVTSTAASPVASVGRPDSAASHRSRSVSRHVSASRPSRPAPSMPHAPESSSNAQVLAAAERRRVQRRRSASIQRINDRLQAMIREGREALGTKIEIEDAQDGVTGDGSPAEGDVDRKSGY